MTRCVAENFSLREEIRRLRCLESAVRAEEDSVQVAAELEEAFQRAVETERPTEGKITLLQWSKCQINVMHVYFAINSCRSTVLPADSVPGAAMEKLKAQLLQKQCDLTGVFQAFEEYKEITR